MKFIFTLLLISSLSFLSHGTLANPAGITSDGIGTTQVVPNSYAAINAPGTFLGPLANSQRTYQLLIQASQLTGLVGQNLTGVSMRLPGSASANWPAADINFSNYDIYLSGSVEPSARSLTFANNVVGPQTQVRSGPLTILAGSYIFGGNPTAFGTEITFTTPWLYSGGNVLVEIRHQGFSGSSSSVNALLTSTPGYGTLVSACWTGNYLGTAGTAGNFAVLKLSGTAAAPKILALEALIEGLYDGAINQMVSDTAKVYLRNNFAPYSIVDSAVSVLDGNGFGIFNFYRAVNGVNYYIVVDQRNSIDTWSATGNDFTNDSLVYDFTTAASQAFGSNQVLDVTRYAIYSGDVNKDGSVDVTDLSLIDNAAFNFTSGYVVEDLNGDLVVDVNDAAICDNNAFNFVAEIRP